MSTDFKDFKIEQSKIIKDIYIFKPSVSCDIRGTIYTTFFSELFKQYLPEDVCFKHDKFSDSRKDVLRGLHGDEKTWKLVTCIYGEIFQVVVDYRPESNTFLKWEAFTINNDNRILVLLPPRFANGYYVKSEQAIYHYKLAYMGEYYDVDQQFVLKWDDSRLGIPWPSKSPVLSQRDK